MPQGKVSYVSARLSAAGLQPTVVAELVRVVDRWNHASGPEWTVGRLKSLKVDFVRLLARKPPLGSYAKRPGGLPKGVFGYLFTLGASAARKGLRRKLNMVWNALILYTRYEHTDVSRSQWKKFSTAVRRDAPREGQLANAAEYMLLGIRYLPVPPVYSGKPKSILFVEPREGKRMPTLRRETAPESEMLNQAEMFWYQNGPLTKDIWVDCLSHVLKGTPWAEPSRRRAFREGLGRGTRLYSGMIGLIQEPGCKLRAVANPNRVIQLALQPLGRQLFSWLKNIPQDCTFNQTEGIYAVQSVVSRGVSVSSLDLSNATDRFPYRLMELVLDRAAPLKGSRDLLWWASRGDWYLPARSRVAKAVKLKWNVGTPLGLYPCFALFALAHHALVRGICVRRGRKDFPYRILGDDIVIWDDSVSEEYKSVMESIGCPIAMDKSLDSHIVAEFAGRVILADAILHGQKYREGSNDNSFLETVKSLGPQSIRVLPPKQRRVARHVCELIPPHGFGWNPEGKSFEWRLVRTFAWLAATPTKVEPTAIAQTQRGMRAWYESAMWQSHSVSTGVWSSPDLDPLSSAQGDSVRSEFGWGLRPHLLRGNLEHLLSDEWSAMAVPALRTKGIRDWIRRVTEGNTWSFPDHPFNKPLVQSLERRRQAALACESMVEYQLFS